MKSTMIALLAAATLAVGIPAMASEQAASKKADVREQVQQETIQEKIARFEREVAKGTSTYSAEELSKLQLKLKDAENLLYVLTHGS